MPKETLISAATVRKHCTAADCWIVVDGNVWDVSAFLAEHPGGVDGKKNSQPNISLFIPKSSTPIFVTHILLIYISHVYFISNDRSNPQSRRPRRFPGIQQHSCAVSVTGNFGTRETSRYA